MTLLRTFVTVAAITLANSLPAQASVPRAYVRIDVPQQDVKLLSGGVGVFGVEAILRSDGHARGVFKLRLPNRISLQYDVIAGAWRQNAATGEIGVILYLRLRRDGKPRRADFAVATATPHPRVPGCDIWDFMSNGIVESHSAMGDIYIVRAKRH